jgi:imidazolonepropionase-like amidohydrolase
VLAPFLVLGVYQSYARDNIREAKLLSRDVARSRSWLIRGARIFVGDGKVIGQGAVLVRNGKIEAVYEGTAPSPESLNAEAIEAAGKTLLPGLIDMHVHLGSPGLISANPEESYRDPDANIDRALAAYLYSGVTAVKSVGDGLEYMLRHRATIASGDRLGAELFAVGPMFTAESGHGTEYFAYIPQPYRDQTMAETVRLPKTPEEARSQVAELKTRGVDGIKAILEAGGGSTHFNRLDVAILRAIVEASRAAGLPMVSHTGNAHDFADALAAGVGGIEHGAIRDTIPAELFVKMREAGVTYDPTLAVLEAIQSFIDGSAAPLERSLVQQIVPADVLSQALLLREKVARSAG